METVRIVPRVLKQQVEEGWKLPALAEHYGLPLTQMKKALKAQDLKIRKFHAPKFVFTEEVDNSESVLEFGEGDISVLNEDINTITNTNVEITTEVVETVDGVLDVESTNTGISQEGW